MPFEFMPLDQCVFSNPDGSVLVRLIPSELLVYPRMCVSREPQSTLRFPLFDCSDETFYAVLAGIHKVFLVLDDLADFTNEGVVVTDHSIKAIIGMDASRPSTMQEYHLIVRQQTLRGFSQLPERLSYSGRSYLQA